MSVRAGRAFLPALREIERGLALPIPERVRILHELEADLVSLRERFVSEGVPPAEADRRALEALLPGPGALGELGRLHRPLYLRLTEGLDERRLRLAERTALVLAAGSVLLVQTLALFGADLLRAPSPFLWPVLGLGGALACLVATKVFELWVKGDHRAPRRRLRAILGLSLTIMGVGLAGFLLDFYALASTLAADPAGADVLASRWLVRDAALLSVSLLLALGGALTWFVLTRWLTLVSDAHRRALGLGPHDEDPTKEVEGWR